MDVSQTTERASGRQASPTDYPEDRFDRVEHRGRGRGRVGAHRINSRPRYVWHYLIAGLLGFALLTAVGILGVHLIGQSGNLPSLSDLRDTEEPEAAGVAAELDPDATVAVLNGTETPNLAAGVDQAISEQELGTILFSGSAAESDVQISAVFYMDDADEAAAKGLAQQLGGLSTYSTENYGEYEARLVVLLGSDYAGPGFDEAEALTEEARSGEPGDGETAREINPETGNEIDPVTGWDIDPVTGWPVDPATGVATDPATLPAG